MAKKSAKKTKKSAKPAVKKAAKKKVAAKKTKRTPSAAFMRPVQPSAALEAVVGGKAIPRTEVTKKIWAYIKRNGLQDKIRSSPEWQAREGKKSGEDRHETQGSSFDDMNDDIPF